MQWEVRGLCVSGGARRAREDDAVLLEQRSAVRRESCAAVGDQMERGEDGGGVGLGAGPYHLDEALDDPWDSVEHGGAELAAG